MNFENLNGDNWKSGFLIDFWNNRKKKLNKKKEWNYFFKWDKKIKKEKQKWQIGAQAKAGDWKIERKIEKITLRDLRRKKLKTTESQSKEKWNLNETKKILRTVWII